MQSWPTTSYSTRSKIALSADLHIMLNLWLCPSGKYKIPETAAFTVNPGRLWTSGELENKRTVLKLLFTGKSPYRRNEGFRTPETSLPVKLLSQLSQGKSEMARPIERSSNILNEGKAFLKKLARPRGFEPLTF